jgi:hypothetical protein
LVTDDGGNIVIGLRMEDISDNLEVACISARELETGPGSRRFDDFRLTDFRIDRVFVLRRAEWLERPEHAVASVGQSPQAQHIGDPSDAPQWMDS